MNMLSSLKTAGLTNSDIGFTMGEVTSTPKVTLGICTGWIEYEEPNKTPGFGMRKKRRDCDYTTYDMNTNYCPQCGYRLVFKQRIIGGVI